MNTTNRQKIPQIFISYTRKNKEIAEEIYQKLSDSGFKPWMDIKDLLPGEEWQTAISKAIRKSDFFLALFSTESVGRRGFLQKELKHALDIWEEMLEDDIYFIPVRLDGCEIPDRFQRFQWLDLFAKDGFSKLINAISEGYRMRTKELITTQPSTSIQHTPLPFSVTSPSSPAPKIQQDSIVIVTVTKTEAQAVLDVFSQATGKRWTRQAIKDKTYYNLGIHGGAPVYMVQSEMGTATPGGALLTVRQAIQDQQPQAIIMCGIAFGLRPDKQQLGDILVAKQLQYYEPQKVDLQKGQIPRGDRTMSAERLLDRFRSGDNDWEGAKTHFGLILSGEKLVNDPAFRQWLLETEPEAIGGEMEGAGLYAAARDAKVDWILVKAVCDWADGKKIDTSQVLAARNSAQFVLHVLQQGGWGEAEQVQKSAQPIVNRAKLNAYVESLRSEIVTNLHLLDEPIAKMGFLSDIRYVELVKSGNIAYFPFVIFDKVIRSYNKLHQLNSHVLKCRNHDPRFESDVARTYKYGLAEMLQELIDIFDIKLQIILDSLDYDEEEKESNYLLYALRFEAEANKIWLEDTYTTLNYLRADAWDIFRKDQNKIDIPRPLLDRLNIVYQKLHVINDFHVNNLRNQSIDYDEREAIRDKEVLVDQINILINLFDKYFPRISANFRK